MPRVYIAELGRYASFPEGISREEMKSAIEDLLAREKPQTQSNGDGVRVGESIKHGLKSGAGDLVDTVADYASFSRNVSMPGIINQATQFVSKGKAPDIFSAQKSAEDVLREKAQKISDSSTFEPAGIAEKTLAGLGAVPAGIASIAPALGMTALAAPAGPLAPAIGFGVHGAIRGGDGEITPRAAIPAAIGAAEGAAFGYLPKGINKVVPASKPVLRSLAQNLGISGIAAGSTAAHGGDAEDVAASAATMFAVGGLINSPRGLSKAKNKIKNKLEDVALQEAKDNIQFSAPRPKVIDKQEFATRVVEGFFDPDIRIRRAVIEKKRALNDELSPLEDPEQLRAGFYPSTASSQTRAAAKHGLIDPIDPQAAPKTKSLKKMSEDAIPAKKSEVGKYNFRSGLFDFEEDFQSYLYSRRTKEVLQDKPDYQGFVDDPDAVINAVKRKYSPETIKKWDNVQGDFAKIGNYVVDFLKRSGVFNEDQAQTIKSKGDVWVNMGRVFDESDPRSKGSSAKKAVWALKAGGKEKMGDLWANMGSFIERGYKQANFQYYMKSLVDLLGDSDPNMQKVGTVKFTRGMPQTRKTAQYRNTIDKIDKNTKIEETTTVPGEVKRDVTAVTPRPMFDDANRVVTFRRDGKPESWQFSKEWYDAIRGGSTRPESHWLIDMTLGKAKRMATLGRTGLNPGFSLITNVFRDLMTGALQSADAGALGQNHFERIIKTTIGRRLEKPVEGKDVGPIGESRKLYELSGARIAGPVEADIKMGLAFRDQVLSNPEGFHIPRNAIKHPVEAAREFLAWSEDVNRFPEYYLMGEKYGHGTAEAHVAGRYAAQEGTLNFARMGKYARWANEYIPFFNASLQGARKFAVTMKNNPKAATIRALSTITFPAMTLWAINKDERWYQEIPAWEKALFMHFKVGDTVWRVPMPFEWFTAFGALPVAAADAIYQERPEVFKEGLNQAFETISPEIIPQFLRPPIETAINKDLFKNRTIESEAMKRMLPSERYRESTPYIYRAAGKLTNTSPVKIQHLAESYSGGLIRDPAEGVDILLGKTPKEGGGIPLLNRLISNQNRQGQSVSDFYNEHEEMQKVWNTAKRRARDGEFLKAREILLKNADLLGMSSGEIELLVRRSNWPVPDKMSRYNKARLKMSEIRKRKGEAEEITTIARGVLNRD